MSQQPTKPVINPAEPIKKRDGMNEPGSKPGYQQGDPSRRDVSPGEKPERNDKEKQSEPTRQSPPDIQMS
jgi:hypothetical protein